MHKKGKYIIIVWILWSIFFFSITSVAADIPLAQDRRILKSASELDYPPFCLVKKDGTADGFSIDLLKAVTRTVGLDIHFIVGPWKNIKQKLIQGRIDVLPLVAYSKERDRFLDFTAPYLRMHGTVFVRRNNTSIRSEADLKDKEVIVMQGDTAHEYALRHKLSNHLVLTKNFTQAMKLLSKGHHDAVIVQQLVGLQLIKKLNISNLVDIRTLQDKTLKPMDYPLSGFEQKFCIAVHEGDKDLLADLNEGLSIVITNGTYNKLYDKWFGPILPRPSVDLMKLLKDLAFILLPLLILSALSGIWYLRREIARKTMILKKENEKRKIMMTALQESEKKYRGIFENAVEGFFQSTPEGKFINVNPAFATMLGYASALELVNLVASIGDQYYVDIKDREKYQYILKKTGSIKNFEFKARCKDGSYIWVSNSTRAIYGPNGEITRYEGNVSDITARKRTEHQLMKERRQLLSIFDSMDAIIYVSDPHTHEILYANKSMQDRFKKQLTGKICYKEIQAKESVCEFCTNTIILEQNPAPYPWQYHNALINRDFSAVDRIIKWPDGRDVRFEFALDITEKNQLEARLQQAQKMEAIGTLAGGIAHDFNNILFPIVGYTEMLIEDTPEGSPLRESLDEIHHAALRARDLVKQILTFSRQGSDPSQLMKPAPVIREALKLVRASIPRTIDIIQDIDDNIGVIKADPTQMHQVIMNLATNAFHAMEKNGGKLRVSLKKIIINAQDAPLSDMKQGIYALLTMADTGIGMDRQIIEKIFDPFFTTKGPGRGTGMGLSVVHGIIKTVGGSIHVYSEPDKGTTFNIYLPVLKPLDSGHQVPPAKEPFLKGSGQILLVDDETAIITMEKRMLERLGYQVISRTSSIEALEAFRADPQKFDLIITDMAMPEMPGDKLAARVIKIRPDIPILLCTGFSQTMSEKEAAALGIRGFLMKPIVMTDLSCKVYDLLK